MRIVHSYLMLSVLLLLWASIQFYFSVFIQTAGSNKTSIVNAKAISENLNRNETKQNTHDNNNERGNHKHRVCVSERKEEEQNTFAVHVK